MKTVLLVLFSSFLILIQAIAKEPIPPPVKNKFLKVTSCEELTSYIRELDQQSVFVTAEVFGKSSQGRDMFALLFSSTVFGQDSSKLKVLIFAQQHGNEQSGKEGALLLSRELVKPENRYLLEKLEIALIPQMNPDGSEKNQRRNGHDMDLNRNHLILTEPETMALHQLFDKYHFEATLDVHEYSPFGDDWKKYGYRKNADVTLGSTTNLNVSNDIRKFSNEVFMPYYFKYLANSHFTSFTYCPGGPPEVAYIRHSTFDINDGRQGFGILNTFSFIQEGMNGKDDLIENLQNRAESQMTGMRGFLEFIVQQKDKIGNLVNNERARLISGKANPTISIQSEHVSNGQLLRLPLLSYSTGKDTLVTVTDYRPVVQSVLDVSKPIGYLIPKNNEALVQWVSRQAFVQRPAPSQESCRAEAFFINAIDSIDFEGDKVVNPHVTMLPYTDAIPLNGYIFLPTDQLKGNLLVLSLEPQSMLGLVTYKNFADMLRPGQLFPVLRVTKR